VTGSSLFSFLHRERARQIEGEALEKVRAHKHVLKDIMDFITVDSCDDEIKDFIEKPKRKSRRGNPRNAPRVRRNVKKVDGAESGGDNKIGDNDSVDKGSVKASVDDIFNLGDEVEKGEDVSDTDPEIQDLMEQFSATKV